MLGCWQWPWMDARRVVAVHDVSVWALFWLKEWCGCSYKKGLAYLTEEPTRVTWYMLALASLITTVIYATYWTNITIWAAAPGQVNSLSIMVVLPLKSCTRFVKRLNSKKRFAELQSYHVRSLSRRSGPLLVNIRTISVLLRSVYNVSLGISSSGLFKYQLIKTEMGRCLICLDLTFY
jgi:hypothetical protein